MIEKIKQLVSSNQPIKARKIARLLDVDSAKINSVLYAHENTLFICNDQHEWSLQGPLELIVQFPTVKWLTAEDFEDALNAVDSPLESDCSAVVFKFAPNTAVLLEAAARLLSLCNQLVAANKAVTIEFEPGKASSYLNRLGFYGILHKSVNVLPRRPRKSAAEARKGESDAVVEVEPIDLAHRNENIPQRLSQCVKQHVADATVATHTIVSELFSNIYEHSSSPIPGFAALQLYRGSNPHIATVFSDSGTGITGSLLPTLSAEIRQALKQPRKSIEVALIEKIFTEGGLSRTQIQGHGTGLISTGNAARKFEDATVIVRQETFEVTMKFRNGQRYFKHRAGLRKLAGTQICVKFNLTRAEESR